MTGLKAPRVLGTEGEGAIADRVRARRNGVLRPIDRMLLHSPAFADGWNGLLGAVRSGLSLRGDIRELVVLRIAVLNDAQYEWDSHRASASAEGLSDAVITALRSPDPTRSGVFSPLQLRVLALTDSITRDIRVPDDVFDAVRDDLSVTELVELVATISTYNMVSRFAVALQISETGGTP